MTSVFIRRSREDAGTQRPTGRRWPCEDGGRDRNESPTSQGTPRMAVNHQKLERGIEAFFPRTFRRSMTLSTP